MAGRLVPSVALRLMTHELAESLLRCPVGCNFLRTIERDKAPLDHALAPAQAFAYAAVALEPLSPWSPIFGWTVPAALTEGARLSDLAHEVASHPAASWWTAPMDGTRQVLVTDGQRESDMRSPERNLGWEDYAQRHTQWRLTATLHGDYSCADVVIAGSIGDWPPSSEQRRFVAEIGESARVLEISTPEDWHSLCVSFPRVDRNTNTPDYVGVGTLVPDWSLVAEQWDGVHMTFAGLLTTPLVRWSTAAGATMMWSWDTEGTMWLPGEFLRAGRQLPTFHDDDFTFPDFLMDGPDHDVPGYSIMRLS